MSHTIYRLDRQHEALAVRGRALAGRGTGGVGGHWSEVASRERLAEVLGRVGSADGRAALKQALRII